MIPKIGLRPKGIKFGPIPPSTKPSVAYMSTRVIARTAAPILTKSFNGVDVYFHNMTTCPKIIGVIPRQNPDDSVTTVQSVFSVYFSADIKRLLIDTTVDITLRVDRVGITESFKNAGIEAFICDYLARLGYTLDFTYTMRN